MWSLSYKEARVWIQAQVWVRYDDTEIFGKIGIGMEGIHILINY